MADKIVSWGGFNSKGTDGMGVTGSFQVSSSANSFFVGGGSVGIGTTNPIYKLHTTDSAFFQYLNSSFNILINPATGNIGTTANTSLYFITDNTQRVSILNTGLVGIGITTPTARLQVRGSGTTSSTTSLLVQNANASSSFSVLDNSKIVIGSETVSQASLYIGHNGTSGGNNGTSTVFFASQFGGNYPYRLGAEGNGYNFYLRQISGGQGSINIDFSGLNSISYNITNTNILNQSFSTSSIIVTKATLNSYLAIGNTTSFNNSQTEGDTPLIFFRSMGGSYYDKTVDAAVTIRNGLPTAADDNITKNTAFWYRNGYIGIGTSTSLFATNTLQGALTINQGTNTGYANRFPTTASLVNTSGTSTTVTFTPDNGNTAASYNIIVGTIIIANGVSRKVTAVQYNSVTVDTAVDWSGGYPYTYRNPYVSIADGSTPLFDISPSGSVGIGTSTPSASLHISGASSNVLLEIDSPTQNNILYVSGSGNVGIGTSTPAAKLDVNGTFKVSSTSTFDSQATFNNANIVATGINSQVGNFVISRAHSNTSVEILGGITSVKFDASDGSASTMFRGNTSIASSYITASAMLHVRSTGTTSSTTALLVQNSNATASLSVLDDGSVGIGTASPTTGGGLTVANPAYTNSGRFYQAGNSTTTIGGGPAGENITFGPSNRIFLNAGQVRFPGGSVQMAQSLTLGSTNATGTNMLLMLGSVTAGSALGRGIGMDTTLVAAANNDVLVGVDINPTFNNGAYTGVNNYALRVSGSATISNVLTLTPQDPLPSGVPTGSFAVSSSAPPKPYFYDGTTWNALY
jgi:hypothetical protein